MNKQGLRVLTYNIHKGFNVGNRRFVLHQIRDALIAADADLMFLQEMQGEHLRHEKKIADWPVLSQLEFLAENIWPYHAYGKNAIYNAGHHGNAILSKHPFERWENINVSPFPWASRSLLHGVIRLPGMAAETAPGSPRHSLPPWKSEVSQSVGNRCDRLPGSSQDVHIVCIHFGLTGKERRLQIGKLCARIDSHVPHDAPLIIAGDFNDWLGQADRFFHDHLGLLEIFREIHGRYARSFPAWMPFLPMDRIYYRGLTPVSCERLSHAPWHALSDHAPLTASFTL
ncbi:endonuclease/exonuclease/phosphatase family protein [Methylobacter sp.]|uniref:endonuclease/exonuclease/phosphatase family protein n=1 Tax=Methylobacter sp. TaxID=2051955 RepID=UPI00248A10B2|nr:endonuclease/exonuclease/phosphatase family protein [Methylobacter sp.]MDI1277799.1 endonuclease/exonuclease/phosphatase family protein [Methylobacter sp.]MDI1358319.1 endonuclease/exonuclease/phosphatase family protein [Methylobacter sp.]